MGGVDYGSDGWRQRCCVSEARLDSRLSAILTRVYGMPVCLPAAAFLTDVVLRVCVSYPARQGGSVPPCVARI